MARIRSVHPALCEDEALAAVSPSAERTFIRLWTHLDDEGRGEDRPKLLSAYLYPEHDEMDPEAVDADLQELASADLLIRYKVKSESYLCSKPDAWKKYQKPRHPRPSYLPPPPDGGSRTAKRRKPTAKRRPVVEGSGEGVGVGEGDINTSSGASHTDTFEDFWIKYPKQKNGTKPDKKRAREQWRKLKPDQRTLALTAVENYTKAVAQGTYVKHAFRWLRDDNYTEYPGPPSGNGHKEPEDVSPFSSPNWGSYQGPEPESSCEHSTPMCSDCRGMNIKRLREAIGEIGNEGVVS